MSKGRADADIFVILFSLKVITLFGEQIKTKYLHENHELKSNCTNVRKVMDDLVCEHVVSKEKVLGGHRQQVLLVCFVNNKRNLDLTVNVVTYTSTHRFQRGQYPNNLK